MALEGSYLSTLTRLDFTRNGSWTSLYSYEHSIPISSEERCSVTNVALELPNTSNIPAYCPPSKRVPVQFVFCPCTHIYKAMARTQRCPLGGQMHSVTFVEHRLQKLYQYRLELYSELTATILLLGRVREVCLWSISVVKGLFLLIN